MLELEEWAIIEPVRNDAADGATNQLLEHWVVAVANPLVLVRSHLKHLSLFQNVPQTMTFYFEIIRSLRSYKLDKLVVVKVFVGVGVGVVHKRLESSLRHVLRHSSIEKPRFQLAQRNSILAKLKQSTKYDQL